MVLDDFISDFKDSTGCASLEELSGIPKSGWIPLQQGGFVITELYNNGIDPSYHFNDAHSRFNDKKYEDFIEQYMKNNELDEIDYNDDNFQIDELELFDPTLLKVTIYVDSVENEKLVKIQLAVNYTDAPYYTQKYDNILKELTYPTKEFMNVNFVDVLEQLKNYHL
jgi:hypothetical protein